VTRDLSDALFRFATVLGVPVAWVDGLVVPAGGNVVDRVPLTEGFGFARRSTGRHVDRFVHPGRGTVHLWVADYRASGTAEVWARKPLCAGTPSEMAAHLNHLSVVACHLDHLRTCTAADIRVRS
jgi:hypothetical protein